MRPPNEKYPAEASPPIEPQAVMNCMLGHYSAVDNQNG